MRRPRYYFVLTVCAGFSCGIIFWILPNTLKFTLAPLAVILSGLVVVLGYVRHLISFNWTNAIPHQKFVIVAGTLTPFILFSYIQEVDESRVDNTTGMALVGTIFLIVMLVMYRNLREK